MQKILLKLKTEEDRLLALPESDENKNLLEVLDIYIDVCEEFITKDKVPGKELLKVLNNIIDVLDL